MMRKLITPPFTMDSALEKVKELQEVWATLDPNAICSLTTIDTQWRDRIDFCNGQEAVKEFLTKKWAVCHNYTIHRELWGFRNHRMAVRFESRWQEADGRGVKGYGIEVFEFDDQGCINKRYASENDLMDE